MRKLHNIKLKVMKNQKILLQVSLIKLHCCSNLYLLNMVQLDTFSPCKENGTKNYWYFSFLNEFLYFSFLNEFLYFSLS